MDYIVRNSRQEVVKGEIHVIFVIFQNVQISKLQLDADLEACVLTNTQLNLLMKKQHRLQFTFHRIMNDRCN